MRTGECNQCGDCCLPPSEERLAAYRKAGVIPDKQHIYGCADSVSVDGKITCTDYDNRPKMCRDFPLSPLDIVALPNCSYKFVGS